MNERIKELAEQAKAFIVEPEHASVGGVSEVSFDKYSDLEKFAESLIKETLDVARAGLEYGDGMDSAVYRYFELK